MSPESARTLGEARFSRRERWARIVEARREYPLEAPARDFSIPRRPLVIVRALAPEAWTAFRTRREAFERCLHDPNVIASTWAAFDRKPLLHPSLAVCPCCAYPTIAGRNDYEICCICWWEDDGQDDADASLVRGGPNEDFSLDEARWNFASIGDHYETRSPRREGFLAVSRDRRLAVIARYDALLPAAEPAAYVRASFEIGRLLVEVHALLFQWNRRYARHPKTINW